MSRLIECMKSTGGCLWLDDAAYAGRLLADGNPPLLEVPEFVAFRTQASALLHSDVLTLALAPVCEAWLDAHPELLERMGRKQRAVAPLRALLGDDGLRDHLVSLTRAVRQALSGSPLVLSLPSPRAWAHATHARCGLEGIAVEQNEVDKASVYVAEFLRTFAECSPDGILLCEDADNVPADPAEIDWYRPVLNVAEHYRWPVGLNLSGMPSPRTLPPGIDFAIADDTFEALPTAVALPSSIWTQAPAPDAGPACRFAAIPAAADPQSVLATIEALRPH